MLGEYLLPVCAGLVGVATLAVVFSFAPLTGSGSSASQTEQHIQYMRGERGYCSTNLSDVNCACFGRVAAQILSDTQPKVPGAYYMRKEDLARSQALGSC